MRDLASIQYYEKVKEEHPGDEGILQRAWKGIVRYGRDNARTPMQWNGSESAGFSTTKPWMRVNDNYTSINVASQLHSPHSIRSFWKKMIALRKSRADLFIHGAYRVHDLENPHTFTFEKTSAGGKKALVMLNFSDKEQTFKVPGCFEGRDMRCLISNDEMPGGRLGAWEGRVYVEEDQD